MKTDLLMFVIGMSMSLVVSVMGLLLAYRAYRKNQTRDSAREIPAQEKR